MTAAFAGALKRGEDVQQKGIVAVLRRRNAELEAPEFVFAGIKAVAPGFGGERRIGHDEVEGLETPSFSLKCGLESVLSCQISAVGTVVQDHVHPRQRGGGVVHFLPVDGKIEPGVPCASSCALRSSEPEPQVGS